MNKKPFLIFFIIYVMYNVGVVGYYQFDKIIHLIYPAVIKSVSINNKFCLEYNKFKPLMATYSKIQWPVTGVPGIIPKQNFSLENMCDYILKSDIQTINIDRKLIKIVYKKS